MAISIVNVMQPNGAGLFNEEVSADLDIGELYVADSGDGAQDNILLENGDLLLLE